MHITQENSPYEGGKYEVDIVIPDTYPFSAPKMRFITLVLRDDTSVARPDSLIVWLSLTCSANCIIPTSLP